MTIDKAIWRPGPELRALTLGLLLLAALGLPAPGPAQERAVIQDLDVVTLPGGRVQLRFRMSAPVPAPRNFTIDEPARIVLDFPATGSALPQRRTTINTGVVESLTVLEASDRARATLNLARMVPFSLRSEGDAVLLTLDAGGGFRPAATLEDATATAAGLTPPRTLPMAGEPAVPATGADRIREIDFRRGPEGQGVINITLADPGVAVDVREQGERIIADFRNARLPRGQERRLDVTDFGTPVNLIDALNQNGGARISVLPSGRYEYLAYQTGNLYTIEVIPIREEEQEERARTVFSGETLSLNFQDIEVRAVLQIIADFTGLNVVVSDSVQGNLTLRLQNVPWDQALDIILRTKGLSMRQNGNVVYVAPTEEITAREQLELQAQQQRTDTEPLRTELIQLNYAKAEDLREILKKDENSFLSRRGSVTIDNRTNTLLVNDVPGKISEVRELVSQLDVKVNQVLIDARVVIATDDFRKEIGVRFGGTTVQSFDNNGIIGVGGSAEANNNIVNDAISNLNGTGQPFPVNTPSLQDRLGVNLPIADAAGRLALVLLNQDYLLDLELSALQAEGRGEVLSNPRVVTTDGSPARIKQGVRFYFQFLGDDGVPVTEEVNADLALAVTPQITPDGSVFLELEVTKNEPDFGLVVDGRPAIRTREVETKVLIENGQTLVLGGVFEETKTTQADKVPFLGDLPVIDRFFKRNLKRDNKQELLIFVTPQIVTENLLSRN